MAGTVINIFLCGDVMTGRGIDQVLPHPCDPRLHEPYVRDARRYVDIAEKANGPIPKPVGFAYVWGDAMDETGLSTADARIINLETAVTTSTTPWSANWWGALPARPPRRRKPSC